MNDHGYLFTDPLALSIWQQEKTATRRPMSRSNTVDFDSVADAVRGDYHPQAKFDCRVKLGDSIWIREGWRVIPTCTDQVSALINYRAGGGNVRCNFPVGTDAVELSKWSRLRKDGTPRWTPSLLMPRWAARSIRRVTSVHSELLEPLSQAEAEAEGFDSPAEFAYAWDTAYRAKGRGVAARPWVWVIRWDWHA